MIHSLFLFNMFFRVIVFFLKRTENEAKKAFTNANSWDTKEMSLIVLGEGRQAQVSIQNKQDPLWRVLN